jgi:hypothetical protein
MQNKENFKPDPFEAVEKYEAGEFTSGELLNEISKFCWNHPAEREQVLDDLSRNPFEAVQSVVQEVRDSIRQDEERIKDIDQLRRTSPLQPGVALILFGGYDSAYSESWWLNGRRHYKATFIDFVHRGADKMPAAFVKLEEEIDLTEASGQLHKGSYALLKLRYVADWRDTETVGVHIVDALPADVEAFYSSHPFGTEIESHATYRIANHEDEITDSLRANGIE